MQYYNDATKDNSTNWSFGKSFELMTIDTVKGFLADSRKSNFKI